MSWRKLVYEASLTARRYEVVDPTKRLVARELEARGNAALERVAYLEHRIASLEAGAASRPQIDRAALMALAHDLPVVWNAPSTDVRTKQRLTRILIQEVVIDVDDAANQAVLIIHWNGGRHTEVRVARVRNGRYPEDRHPSPVEVIRKLGGQWPDRELAVTMNRMRCKSADGQSWTTVRVRELRERLGIAAFDSTKPAEETISVDETARRLIPLAFGIFAENRRAFCDSVDATRQPPSLELERDERANPDSGVCHPFTACDQLMRMGFMQRESFAMSWKRAAEQSLVPQHNCSTKCTSSCSKIRCKASSRFVHSRPQTLGSAQNRACELDNPPRSRM